MFPAVNLLVPFPLHLSLIDTQDITLFAFRDVWHTLVLPVIVVGSVLGMLSLNKLCKENTSNSRPVCLDRLRSKVPRFYSNRQSYGGLARVLKSYTFRGRSHLVPLATLEGRSLYTRDIAGY